MKQIYASSGVQTIGSPLTLNDVLTLLAHPHSIKFSITDDIWDLFFYERSAVLRSNLRSDCRNFRPNYIQFVNSKQF